MSMSQLLSSVPCTCAGRILKIRTWRREGNLLSAQVPESRVPSSLIADKQTWWSSLHVDSLLVSPVFPSHFFFSFFSPIFFTKPHSKCSELEEELKNVTNNLKSLEAQAEKVGLLVQGPERFLFC